MLTLFRNLRIKDEKVRDWFLKALRARVRQGQQTNAAQVAELNRQLSFIRSQQDQLVNLRLLEEIESDTFKRKSTELRDKADELKIQIEIADRSQAERARWRRNRSNFRKRLKTNGLAGITAPSARSSKSSVRTFYSTA